MIKPSCSRCAHWGVQMDLQETETKKFCWLSPWDLVEAGYRCAEYRSKMSKRQEVVHEVCGGK